MRYILEAPINYNGVNLAGEYPEKDIIINIYAHGDGYINYDLDTIFAVGENKYYGMYDASLALMTEENTFATDKMPDGTVSVCFEASMLGDVNFDDMVNTGDAVVILKASADMLKFTVSQQQAADVNADFNITQGTLFPCSITV